MKSMSASDGRWRYDAPRSLPAARMTDSRLILDELPLLKFLPPDSQELVRNAFTSVTYPFGTVIVREGDVGDAYYVLVSGRARIVKRGTSGEEVSLNVLRPGDVFGETGL